MLSGKITRSNAVVVQLLSCVNSLGAHGLQPPGSSVHMIFQAGAGGCFLLPGIFQSREDQTRISCVSCTGGWIEPTEVIYPQSLTLRYTRDRAKLRGSSVAICSGILTDHFS